MKLRITQNSIRIRIRKSELAKLSDARKIEESVTFPGEVVFKFSLSVDESEIAVKAKMIDKEIIVSLPLDRANNWINTSKVGIETLLNINEKEKLHILIEKDFPCKDRADEDKSDTFTELVKDKPSAC